MAFQDSPNLEKYDQGIPDKQPGKFNQSVVKRYIIWFSLSTLIIFSIVILGKSDRFQSLVGEGAIEGIVVDDEGVEFPAEIVLAGTSFSAMADINGNFELENIPQGTYSIIFLNDHYGWEEIIVVEAGKTLNMGSVMIPYFEVEENSPDE